VPAFAGFGKSQSVGPGWQACAQRTLSPADTCPATAPISRLWGGAKCTRGGLKRFWGCFRIRNSQPVKRRQLEANSPPPRACFGETGCLDCRIPTNSGIHWLSGVLFDEFWLDSCTKCAWLAPGAHVIAPQYRRSPALLGVSFSSPSQSPGTRGLGGSPALPASCQRWRIASQWV
jgi:hypothetical protein